MLSEDHDATDKYVTDKYVTDEYDTDEYRRRNRGKNTFVHG